MTGRPTYTELLAALARASKTEDQQWVFIALAAIIDHLRLGGVELPEGAALGDSLTTAHKKVAP